MAMRKTLVFTTAFLALAIGRVGGGRLASQSIRARAAGGSL
jgi:hypothetical protein